MKTLKDSKGASIGVHDTVIVNGIVNARAVLSINLDDGTIEVVSVDGHVMTVSPDHCFITKKVLTVAPPTMPLTDAYNKTIGVGDTVDVPSFGLMKQTVRSINHDAGNLDVGLAPCANTTVGPKDCVITKKAGDVAMRPSPQVSGIPPAAPTTALQPGERVEAKNGYGYVEATTVGPHPHGTGQFIFITDTGGLFSASKFRPIKTECEVVVSAALEHLGYDVTEFKFDVDDFRLSGTDLFKLFKAGYLSEPK